MMNKLIKAVPSLWNCQQIRTAVVFKRMFPPRLYPPEKTGPFLPKLKRKHYVYMLEEDTNSIPAGDIDVILATDVDGLGFKGDIVNVKKKLARAHMLPTGVAIYASPENVANTEQIRKQNEGKVRQSESAHRILKDLSGMTLPIPMSSTLSWVLNKTHVKVAFRNCGIELGEDCLKMPEGEIVAPGQYYVEVTVNKLNTVSVKVYVYHHHKTMPPILPPIWSKDPKYKFDMVEVLAEAAKNVRQKSG